MVDNKNQKNKTNWEQAVAIFGEVSTWVVIPIVLALIFGKMLDAHYGTRPFVFLGLTAVAFVVSIFGIVRVVTKYMKKITEEDKNNKENQPNGNQ